jgi:hypothetical protein
MMIPKAILYDGLYTTNLYMYRHVVDTNTSFKTRGYKNMYRSHDLCMQWTEKSQSWVFHSMLVWMWNHWIHTLMMCQAKFGSNWPSIYRGDFQINFYYNRSNLHIVQNTMYTTNIVSSNPTQARCTLYNIMW